jgi:O-succinylbenzoic acid--CoA ligase
VGLELLGRLDSAIASGGETVFPEQVEHRLFTLFRQQGLPLQDLLLLPQKDPLWGERLVALVRFEPAAEVARGLALVEHLGRQLPPSQRPQKWLLCPQLERNALGKWERRRWSRWLFAELSSKC